MSLPPHEELKNWSHEDLSDLFDKEAQALIDSAPEQFKDKLTAMYHGCLWANMNAKNPLHGAALAYQKMCGSLPTFQHVLQTGDIESVDSVCDAKILTPKSWK